MLLYTGNFGDLGLFCMYHKMQREWSERGKSQKVDSVYELNILYFVCRYHCIQHCTTVQAGHVWQPGTCILGGPVKFFIYSVTSVPPNMEAFQLCWQFTYENTYGRKIIPPWTEVEAAHFPLPQPTYVPNLSKKVPK